MLLCDSHCIVSCGNACQPSSLWACEDVYIFFLLVKFLCETSVHSVAKAFAESFNFPLLFFLLNSAPTHWVVCFCTCVYSNLAAQTACGFEMSTHTLFSLVPGYYLPGAAAPGIDVPS